MEADDLKFGDEVCQADGTTGIVWLKWNVEKAQAMYNLTVDTAHTFFVGEGQWLVHNDCDFWLSGDLIKIGEDIKMPLEGGPAWGAIAKYKDNVLKQLALYDGSGDVIYHIEPLM